MPQIEHLLNTKIYKRVHTLAEDLMAAAQKQDQKRFDRCYSELKQICESNESTNKDHPVQWETLADFTEDYTLAISLYEKALHKAETINATDFQSSIGFSVASLQAELNQVDKAKAHLEKAKLSSTNIIDKNLKAEIHNLLQKLKADQ